MCKRNCANPATERVKWNCDDQYEGNLKWIIDLTMCFFSIKQRIVSSHRYQLLYHYVLIIFWLITKQFMYFNIIVILILSAFRYFRTFNPGTMQLYRQQSHGDVHVYINIFIIINFKRQNNFRKKISSFTKHL